MIKGISSFGIEKPLKSIGIFNFLLNCKICLLSRLAGPSGLFKKACKLSGFSNSNVINACFFKLYL